MREDPRPSSLELLLASGPLRADLLKAVRSRVPGDEAEDIVQHTFADALAATNRPTDSLELRRWLFGIARNKVVDFHRKRRREQVGDVPEQEAPNEPVSAKEWMTWAEQELPANDEAKRTLEWMLREGQGEKLESIAESENIPAPRVRQRVSRLRRHFKERWVAQLALVGVVVVTLLVSWFLLKNRGGVSPEVQRDPSAVPPSPSRVQRARELRQLAFEQYDNKEWKRCLDSLDEAKDLDPAGDTEPNVQSLRAGAINELSKNKGVPSKKGPSKENTNDGPDNSVNSPDSVNSVSPAPTYLISPPSDSPTPSDSSAPVPQSSQNAKNPAPAEAKDTKFLKGYEESGPPKTKGQKPVSQPTKGSSEGLPFRNDKK